MFSQTFFSFYFAVQFATCSKSLGKKQDEKIAQNKMRDSEQDAELEKNLIRDQQHDKILEEHSKAIAEISSLVKIHGSPELRDATHELMEDLTNNKA